MNNRDNFSQRTKDILAKRVAFHCSNPECRCHTCMAGSDSDKQITIGIAAHISAAAPGGPRYDPDLSPAERKHIDNAIWLCSNCASMIDRDEKLYTIDVLKQWKIYTIQFVQGKESFCYDQSSLPFVEVDLIDDFRGRIPMGNSPKNLGQNQGIYPSNYDFIQYWTLFWEYSMVLYNNSDVPCYNLLLEPMVDKGLKINTKIEKINNIDRLDNITLNVRYEMLFEGTHYEADVVLRPKIPKELNGTRYLIKYIDNCRRENKSEFEIRDDDFFTKKLI